MSNFFLKNDNVDNSYYEVQDSMSLFDEQFSISEFSNTLTKREEQSTDIIDSSRKAIEKLFNGDADNCDYVLDLSKEEKEAIEVGDLLLDMDKEGNFFAQFKKANGKYGKKIPIKKRLEEEGISQETLLLALQMEAIKAQLESVIDTLKGIEQGIKQIEQGQRNDRIGYYYSGISLVLEARNIKDPYLKKQLYAQALKSLNDANAQMIQDVRSSIDYLVNAKYRGQKKATELIEEHLGIIKQCCGLICKGASVKSIAFFENNEIGAAVTAIGEYGRFLQKMIIPYAGKLSELDANEKFIEKGSWGRIAASSQNCQEITKRLTEKQQFILCRKEES